VSVGYHTLLECAGNATSVESTKKYHPPELKHQPISRLLERATFRVTYQTDLNPTGKMRKAEVIKWIFLSSYSVYHAIIFQIGVRASERRVAD